MNKLGAFVCRLALVGIVGGLSLDQVLVSEAVGVAPSQLIVFGDSLSDMGNVRDATFGVVPGSAYFSGRFSDGPVWAEHLANDLGVGPLSASAVGGTNYAYGGAQTTGGPGVFVRDVDLQLSDYLASHAVDPNALYAVWAGANDLFGGETDVRVPINRVVTTLEALASRGARHFLVPNLPILGRIPNYNRDPAASVAFDALSHQYNGLFETAMESLASRQPQATFYRLDIGEAFSSLVTDPAAWGLANWYDPAAPGLNPGAIFYNRNRIVPNPGQYLFWDKIHPTAAVHAVLGDYAKALLDGTVGDFDTDGEVDAADYHLWRAGFGAKNATGRQGDADGDKDVDGKDFLAWQRGVGGDIIMQVMPGRASVTPEPGAALLVASALAALCRRRQIFAAAPCGPRG
jgi:phospholipase/lecithinase/hemolysin